MDLGVYITCKNEENLIVPCVASILKVFPQAEVIDLGSQDTTLEKLSHLECKVHNRTSTAEEYPGLKNEYSNKHEWVFWVDGDEIYPEECLRLVPQFIESKQYQAYRMAWKNLLLDGKNRLRVSFPIIGGTKLYRPGRYLFRRTWPREVLDSHPGVNGTKQQQPPVLNGLWCWHGKLLARSTVTDPEREEKRILYRMGLDIRGRPIEVHSEWGWENFSLNAFPWSNPSPKLWAR